MVKKSILIQIALILISSLLFTKCANQLPPGGGEIDRVHPKIIEIVPVEGTVNYKENYFEITFSKYVDKRSVQSAIFVSPATPKGFIYDWSGKTLTVYFKDTLKLNTTYTVTIGSSVEDLNNRNKLAEPVSFAFSTGSSIDHGRISGKIYDENPEGVMIFAYRYSGKEINPEKQKPDYISQVGKNGKFTMLGISSGDFFIYAVRNKFGDLLYHKNVDQYGVQYKDISLRDSIKDVELFLSVDDTIPPKVSNVIMKNRNHLTVEFNKPIDSSKVSASNFVIADTINHQNIKLKYFFKGDAKPNQFYLAFNDSLKKNIEWVLESRDIPDLHSNQSGLDRNSFTLKNDRDSIGLKVAKVYGSLPDDRIDYDDSAILIRFNDAADTVALKPRIFIIDPKGNNLGYKFERIDDAEFKLTTETKLKPNTEYIVKTDLKKFTDFKGIKRDTVTQTKLRTANELDFSGASGNVQAVKDTASTFVVLQNILNKKLNYSQKVNTKRQFNFKKVLPGKYLLWGFKDRNKNGKYDNGTIKPFKMAEEFKFYPDTLNLRARWPVTDVLLSFDRD
jgi:hypothetical protein